MPRFYVHLKMRGVGAGVMEREAKIQGHDMVSLLLYFSCPVTSGTSLKTMPSS